MTGSVIPDLRCGDEALRRLAVESDPTLQGIDYLEVRTSPPTDNQRFLEVHFVQKSPVDHAPLDAYLTWLAANPTLLRITGGDRDRDVRVTSTARSGDVLIVGVNHPGDFADYLLALPAPSLPGPNAPRLDPAFGAIEFSFKAGCPSRFDCRPDCSDCDELAPLDPAVDYLAKDFQSFKNALLDRLPTIAPDWIERHEADLGVTLIELLSYVGDQLSYQQDAVANEAYLETARQRVSVRRHARLLDYAVDEGASARAYVVAEVTAPCVIPDGAQLLTRVDVPFGAAAPPLPAVLRPDPAHPEQADRVRAQATVFEAVGVANLAQPLGSMAIHTWDLAECCLSVGTIQLDVEGDVAFGAGATEDWRLRPGRLLLVEEIVGRATGLPADADPTHRQVVRLTKVEPVDDPLYTGAGGVTRLTWDAADALTFPLCVSRRTADGQEQAVAVARGNVLVADQGETREQDWPQTAPWRLATPPPLPPTGLTRTDRATRFLLGEGPLSAWRPAAEDLPVARALGGDAVPQVDVRVEQTAIVGLDYAVAADLIDARPFTQEFVAETMNDGRASLRFGDGTNGLPPASGSFIHVRYRVGRGRDGNVGAGAISHLLLPYRVPLQGAASMPIVDPPIVALRNPMPATGGRDPETSQQVKLRAPVAFRSPQLRAVTEADYAEVAKRHPGVAGAVARFRWTGSWLTVFITVDPVGRGELDPSLAADLKAFVAGFTQTGYDLEIRPPQYVPLDLELFVCVAPDRFRAGVEQAVLTALSSRRLPHGRLGFFHPDRFTFGQPLYLGALLAAAAAVPGVDSVAAQRFSRFFDDDPLPGRPVTQANIDSAAIAIGELEIVEVAGDSSRPERGLVQVASGGGR